jgi:methylglutaconyl-CoA hydratase
MEGNVKTTHQHSIATITFSHPAHNSMPGYQLKALCEAINQAGQDESVKVIVLKSGGDRTFCAGASFNELAAIDNFESGKKFFMGFANVINAMRKCPKFIIGRIQGKAIGGGVGLAAATDYCIATKYASIKLSELALGIGPFVVGPAVERKIGMAAYSQMAINATEWQTANWAKDKGLFQEVFGTTEQLDAYIKHFTEKLCTMSPMAMRLLKTAIWAQTNHWSTLLEERAAISGRLVLSDHTKDAIRKIKA